MQGHTRAPPPLTAIQINDVLQMKLRAKKILLNTRKTSCNGLFVQVNSVSQMQRSIIHSDLQCAWKRLIEEARSSARRAIIDLDFEASVRNLTSANFLRKLIRAQLALENFSCSGMRWRRIERLVDRGGFTGIGTMLSDSGRRFLSE